MTGVSYGYRICTEASNEMLLNVAKVSKVIFTFFPNKQFGQLITILPNSLIMLNTVNTSFSFFGCWFTDQNRKPLDIEDNVSMTFVMG